MEWQDEGIVLSATRLGESDAVLEIMTKNHGRARGFIKGGMGRRNKANLQPGNFLSVNWRSRLETNLGRFTVELLHSPLGNMLGDGNRLAALAAVTSVVVTTMTEREPHLSVYEGLSAIVKLLEASDSSLEGWGAAFSQLELGILQELGYGLDLSECAGTGSTENLIYVSPKSGRAVSEEAGFLYRDKLLSLPAFLASPGEGKIDMQASVEALRLTGYFLDRYVWAVRTGGQPAARERFLSSLQKHTLS
ncbi:DNA repair protein RecO [Kordiimonas sp. SCSIO 12603]|uniref:DNA repair protein RecO n=1 Tax=Kordiimonas sp. SCSIO 12603 TaxID=2829596 RepID=UPI002105A11A|nr:DNA repair protein RecO [Kordiimonas sp. SCSIO 12603]UTW57070.1 DNA repair protein RecO [Kordiimonas sp. SCSIO 12603]